MRPVLILAFGLAPLLQAEIPDEVRRGIRAEEWTAVRDVLAPLAARADAAEDVVYWHGVALFELGDPGAAAPQLRRALELRPDADTARYLARCAAATGDSPTLTELAGRFESDGRIAFLAGRALMRTFFVDPLQVTTSNRKSFESDLSPSDALVALLTDRYRVESEFWEYTRPAVLEAAEPLLRRAVALEPDVADHHVWLGAVLVRRDDWEGALAELRRARALEPVGWEVHALISYCCDLTKRPSESADALLAARRVAPGRTRHLATDLPFRLSRAGRHEKAVQVGLDGIRSDPTRPPRFNQIGISAYEAGDFRAALYGLNNSLALYPDNDASNFALGKIAYDLERFDEAETLLRKAIPADPARTRIYNDRFHFLARALFAQGRKDEALDVLWEVEERADTSGGDGLYLAGRVAYEFGHYTDAAQFFRKAVTDYPRWSPGAWHHYLGRCLWATDQRDEALEHLKTAHTKDRGKFLYARWLFRCYEVLDDPINAIHVCWVLGVQGGEPEIALDALDYVVQKWPPTRTHDENGEPVRSHMGTWSSVCGDVYRTLDRHREAAMFYAAAMRADNQSGWSLLNGGHVKRSRRVFDSKRKSENVREANQAHLGAGFAYVALGDGEKALERLAGITTPSLDSETATVWAGIVDGDPQAPQRLDCYTALGFWDHPFRTGLEIGFVLPGSPLHTTRPALRCGDVVLQFGEADAQNETWINELRAEPLPAVLPLLVKRGERTFRVEVDLAAFVASLEEGEDR